MTGNELDVILSKIVFGICLFRRLASMRHDYPMPFGSRNAVMCLTPRDTADAMYSANTSLRKFEAVGSNKFFQKRCSVVINQISIISQMGTPCEFEFGESEGCHLFVPWAGYRRMEFDGEQYDINAGLNAVIYPNMRRSFKSNSDSSAAVLSVNKDHINHIISNRTDRKIQTENFSHLINIDNSFKKNKLTAFFTICNLIDSQVENQDALVYLGVDDLICRWVAWCVSPPGDEPIPRIEMT